jgi:hypothetical protein
MSLNVTRRISPTSASAKVQAGLLAGSRGGAGERLTAPGAGSRWGSAAEGAECEAAPRRPDAEARPPRPPLSLIPIRLALPITALRDSAPSVAAMTLALHPSTASFRSLSTASSVHTIRAPTNFAAATAAPAKRS